MTHLTAERFPEYFRPVRNDPASARVLGTDVHPEEEKNVMSTKSYLFTVTCFGGRRVATMKALTAALALAAATSLAQAQGTHSHMMLSGDELKWGDAPSVGPGAKIAVIEGPLDKPVPFTFRLKLPANMKVAPHVHPAFERVTVLSGTFHFAHGDAYDEAKTRPLRPGDVAIMPPGAPMFGFTREETVIQLHGVGPWGISYVNPADDPRKR